MNTSSSAEEAFQSRSLAFAVETRRDAMILRALLEVEAGTKDKRFFAAEGSISLASLARNILIQESIPTMVVADGGSTNPESVRNEQLCAIESLAPAAPFDSFVFSPSLDAIVSEASAQQYNDAAQQSPDQARSLKAPDPTTLRALHNHPQIKSFLARVADLQANWAAACADHDL
jgi:hypothetical protein